MERYVFIHGSSVGQSAFVPTNAPELICNDIATKYFQGRTLRQKESAAMKAMFVDLYHSSQGIYSVYSFVNNACFGANGREGQYFAISILCKGTYIYPESIYSMLNSAYDAIFKNGKILKDIENGECQYVISQFSEQKDYLAAFLKKVEEVFDKLVSGEGKTISSNVSTADYDSWRGYKVSIDVCNSTSALKTLTEVGRLYISEEYESASATINTLRAQIQSLQAEKVEIETKHIEAKRSQKSKERDEIEELNSLIRQKDIEINTLQKDNENYEASINAVRKELDKYAKVGKVVADFQDKRSQSQSKDWQAMLKWCLLILIFILTLFSALVNYGFFRNLSPLPEKEQTGETKEVVGSVEPATVPCPAETTTLVVTPKEIEFHAEGGKESIAVATDGCWEAPLLNDIEWISCTKLNDSSLQIEVSTNTEEERNHTFMLKSGSLEKQIKIKQLGKKKESTVMPYTFIVTDETGNTINPNTTVTIGQKITVRVNGRKEANGYGWAFYNCSGDNDGNNTEVVTVTIDGTRDSNYAVFSYGDLADGNKRKKFRLNISLP